MGYAMHMEVSSKQSKGTTKEGEGGNMGFLGGGEAERSLAV